MRFLSIPLLLAALAGLASAQVPPPIPRQAGESAATDTAVQSLMDQIESQFLAPRLSVQAFLNQTGGREELRADIEHTPPVGGPRWLDDKTCQVRLEISGTEVVADLANIAVRHPGNSPIAANQIPRVADQLAQHWFAATGTSTAAGVAPPPPPASPWAAVPSDLRRKAVENADTDAIQNVLASIEPIELTPGHPLREAMAAPAVRQSLGDWLASRPVTAVEYQEDNHRQLVVQVTLAANSSDVFDILRAAVTARNDVAHPTDPADWAFVRNQLIARMAAPMGRAAPPAASTLPVALPNQAPDWVNLMADAVGSSGSGGNPLRAARAAEADAAARLRRQVLDLHLTRDLTIDQAMQRDPRLARLLDRAIARGEQLYKTEYRPDGTVLARMSLDLRLVWAAIANPR